MMEIDLIPPDYRKRIQIQRDLKLAGLICILLVSATLLTSAVLQALIQAAEQKASTLTEKQQIIEQRGTQLRALDEQIRSMSEQLDVLNGLRGGQAAPGLLLAIDRSLRPNSVWLSLLEFARAGSMVNEKSQAVSNGYFIVLPQSGASDVSKAWKIETHMELHGYAHNYAMLSEFVDRLIKQPEVDTVRVIRSELRHHKNWNVVDFELAVLVNPGVQS